MHQTLSYFRLKLFVAKSSLKACTQVDFAFITQDVIYAFALKFS